MNLILQLFVTRLSLLSIYYIIIILFIINCNLKLSEQNKFNRKSLIRDNLRNKYLSVRSDLFYNHCKYEAMDQRFSVIECKNLNSDSQVNMLLCTMEPFQMNTGTDTHTDTDIEIGKLSITNSSFAKIEQTFVKGIRFQFISIKKTNLIEIDLTVFSKSFETLKRLEIIHNDLQVFPLSGRQVPTQVTHLDLYYNSLTTIPDYGFAQMIELKTIDLSFNQISYVGSNAFYFNDKLEYLDLKYNRIKVVNNRAFALRQYNIKLSLDLSHNKMFYLADEVFDRQSPLLLNLSDNHLTSLPEKHFWPLINAMVRYNNGFINIQSKYSITAV